MNSARSASLLSADGVGEKDPALAMRSFTATFSRSSGLHFLLWPGVGIDLESGSKLPDGLYVFPWSGNGLMYYNPNSPANAEGGGPEPQHG